MDIIKKDGRLQKFDEGKIFTSLINASKDIEGIALNESDIKIMVEDIVSNLKNLRKDTPSSSYEIIGVMLDVINRDGFGPLIKSFIEYKN